MVRVASVIAVMLVGAVAGCRSVPRPSAADALAASAAENTRPTAPKREPPTAARPVVFVQDETDEAGGSTERRELELLPLATPARQHEAPLSLADLQTLALQNNPTLAAASARLDASRGRQIQAGLYPNPVVGYHATEIGNQGTAGQQGGFVSQQLVTGGKLRLDQAIAGKEIDEAHFRFHAQEQRVLSDVRIRFYEALVAQRRLELAGDLGQIAGDLVKATRNLQAGRLSTENDLLQAEIRAEDAYILLDNAGNENVEAWRRLAAVIGLPAMPVSALAGELDVEPTLLDWEESREKVFGGNPQLDAARARVERASVAIIRARKELIPNVDLAVSVRHHNVTRDDVANVQVGIPIPIFDRNQGNIRVAEADWMAAHNEVRRLELDLQDRLAVTYRRSLNARQQAARYRQRMVPKARKSLELVRGAYQAGQVDYLTLLTAQQTFVQVNLAYLDSLQELWAAAAELEGQLLSGSLR